MALLNETFVDCFLVQLSHGQDWRGVRRGVILLGFIIHVLPGSNNKSNSLDIVFF